MRGSSAQLTTHVRSPRCCCQQSDEVDWSRAPPPGAYWRGSLPRALRKVPDGRLLRTVPSTPPGPSPDSPFAVEPSALYVLNHCAPDERDAGAETPAIRAEPPPPFVRCRIRCL